MGTTTGTKTERHALVRWRRKQLRGSGFPPPLATRLAKDSRYDLHALIELIERECPPHLAVRILASIDEERPA